MHPLPGLVVENEVLVEEMFLKIVAAVELAGLVATQIFVEHAVKALPHLVCPHVSGHVSGDSLTADTAHLVVDKCGFHQWSYYRVRIDHGGHIGVRREVVGLLEHSTAVLMEEMILLWLFKGLLLR